MDELREWLAAGQYQRVKETAESWLLKPDLSADELALYNTALCAALVAMKEPVEALGPGERGLDAARRSGSPDAVAEALLYLADAYLGASHYSRAINLMNELLAVTPHSDRAQGWIGRVCDSLGSAYRALGRHERALENHRRAYEWGNRHEDEAAIAGYRAHLIWAELKTGQLEAAAALLQEEAGYVSSAPGDTLAQARHLNNRAYLAFLQRDYSEATHGALQVFNLGKGMPGERARACITLHATARALGLPREAMGMGMLAKIQAQAARRPDLDDEVTKSMLQVQTRDRLMPVEDIFRHLERQARRQVVTR